MMRSLLQSRLVFLRELKSASGDASQVAPVCWADVDGVGAR